MGTVEVTKWPVRTICVALISATSWMLAQLRNALDELVARYWLLHMWIGFGDLHSWMAAHTCPMLKSCSVLVGSSPHPN